jgi:hypothetical protein
MPKSSTITGLTSFGASMCIFSKLTSLIVPTPPPPLSVEVTDDVTSTFVWIRLKMTETEHFHFVEQNQ